MENKDHLDEFMQRKFADDDPESRIAFREDYWLQAQALIEAAERRRKRRFFWWWLTGGVGVALAACWLFSAGIGTHRDAGQLLVGVATDKPAANDRPAAGGSAVVHPAGDTLLEATGGQWTADGRRWTVDGRRREKVAATTHRDNTGHAEPTSTAHAPSSRPEERNMLNRSVGQKNMPATKSSLPALREYEPSRPRESRPARTSQPANQGLPDGHADAVPASPEIQNHSASPPAPGTPPGNPLLSPEWSAPGAAPASPAAPESLRSGAATPVRWTAPGLLPLPFRFLDAPLRRLPALPPPVQPPVAETKKHRDWRWQAGVVAAVSSPIHQLGHESAGIGGGLSARLRRKGSPYSFNADLIWRWRKGGLPDSIEVDPAEQLRYSFGYTLDRVQQRVTGVHWLEMPLYAQYHWQQVQAELGVTPMLLLVVQGREDRTRWSSLYQDPESTSSETVRLENRFFTKISASVFAGMEWQATSRFGLGLRIHYQPGALVRAFDGYMPARNRVWAELRLRFLL